MTSKTPTLAKRIWTDLSKINVNEHIELKGKLSYLSWTWAWQTMMEHYPDTYYFFEDRKFDDGTVEVTCVMTVHEGEDSVSRVMWLPVMDHKNRAIPNPDARAISDAKMRCLVKTLGVLGLGLYIFQGTDLPSAEKEAQNQPINADEAKTLEKLIVETETDVAKFLAFYKINLILELPASKYAQAHNMLTKKLGGAA